MSFVAADLGYDLAPGVWALLADILCLDSCSCALPAVLLISGSKSESLILGVVEDFALPRRLLRLLSCLSPIGVGSILRLSEAR